MEYIDKLKHMYTSSCNTVDIRRCVNIQRMHAEKAVINAYKDIFMEVLSIKYNNHPGISKNPLDIDKYLHDSYDRLVKRQNAIRQYEHCAGTDLTLVPGVYENEQLIVKKMWYYNEATLIRLERFVDYNQYDVANFIQLSREMIYNDPAYIRFKKTYAMGVLRAFIPKTKWFWNVLEKAYHPRNNLGKMAIDTFDTHGIYV